MSKAKKYGRSLGKTIPGYSWDGSEVKTVHTRTTLLKYASKPIHNDRLEVLCDNGEHILFLIFPNRINSAEQFFGNTNNGFLLFHAAAQFRERER